MFLALLVPLAVVGFTISRGLTANAESLLEARRLKELAVESFALVLTQDDVTKEILLDPARISQADRKIAAYDANRDLLREIADSTDDPEMLRIVERLQQMDDQVLRPLDSRVLEASAEEGRRAAVQIYFEQYEPVRLSYLDLGRELTRRAEEVAREAALDLERKNRRSVTNVAVALLLGIALVALVIRLITRNVQTRLASLVDSLESLAERDLRATVGTGSRDEIGRIGAALAGAIAEVRSALERVSGTSNEVETQVITISRASALVASVAAKQATEVRRAGEAMEKATAQVWGIAESARVLRSMVDQSRGTIDSISAVSDGFRERSELLNARIEEATASVQEMSTSTGQVSAGLDVLADAARETSGSAQQMAAGMGAVSDAVTRSEERWKALVQRGQDGLARVQDTMAGIEEVRRTTQDAESVVRGLAERAGEIGSIVGVINGVADETNLLALNAAIIAAQAGERGQAFSVVASEIRSLAARVTTHTGEIEALIGAVQTESANAIEAIGRGTTSVATVQETSGRAGEVVQDMMRSSEENAVQLVEIAESVRQQSAAARRVVELMERTDRAMDRIREAVAGQIRGNEGVLASTDVMRDAAGQMSSSALEQAQSLRAIEESVQSIRDASEAVERALDEQTQATLSVAEFLEQVEGRSSQNTRSAELTSEATRELQRLVEGLRREVLRFRL